MLKTVSSVANALGALNYKGTWNASTNTPTLASGVGTQGDYYVVSVAGATTLDGITNWGVGDWATFNGSVWQRVEGGADGNFVNLDVTATSTTNTLNINSASSAMRLQTGGVNRWVWEKDATNLALYRYDAGGAYQGNPFRVNNSNGHANFEGNVSFNAGSGIDFSATAGTGTSELFDDYEEGTWTAAIAGLTSAGSATYTRQLGWYTKVGNVCHLTFSLVWTGHTGTGTMVIDGLPFNGAYYGASVEQAGTIVDQNITLTASNNLAIGIGNSGSIIVPYNQPVGGGANATMSVQATGTISGEITYRTA
jgi:hypothetical protein